MKLSTVLLVLMTTNLLGVNAQTKKQLDRKAIKAMSGSFEVSFNFAETFQYSEDTAYTPSAVKHEKAIEYVKIIAENENKIVMQHLLLVGRPSNPKVIKHWRQDWLYENTDFYTYDGDNKWKFKKLPKEEVKGQWTQKVYQVDDSPRYEGSATWVHVDGRSTWENTTDAPLPRREYTKRDDYNVTVRTNRLVITDNGWIHDQDNDKVVRKAGKEDVLLAREKGYNTYFKVDDSRCEAAKAWWEGHKEEWALVRVKWEEIFNRNQDLHLKSVVNNKPLFEHLLDKEFSYSKTNVDNLLEEYIIR